MKISPLGDSAIILDFADEGREAEKLLPRVLSAAAALENANIPGLTEVTSSYQSVAMFLDLPRVAKSADNHTIAELLEDRIKRALHRRFYSRVVKGRLIQVPVCYADEYGLDLRRMAAQTGLAVEQVIALHSGAKYVCVCVGFMPGFPYLAGSPPALHLPRLQSPRSKVAAGSVAVANAQAGIYPFDAPGGWNVLGRTPVPLFDPKSNRVAHICAGDRVRFHRITREEFDRLCGERPLAEPPSINTKYASATCTARVLSASFQTTVQDSGRLGFRKFGVTTAGALDDVSLRLCNLLVGNEEGAAGLEVGAGTLRLEFGERRLVSWAGGQFDLRVGERSVPSLHCARVPAGAILRISAKQNGRAWLAISGGIEVDQVLGSRSTDSRAKFGGFNGRPLRDGDELPLGHQSRLSGRIADALGPSGLSDWSAPVLHSRREIEILRIVRGRNWGDFPAETGVGLLGSTFRVSMNSDRMGLRLEGTVLSSLPEELVSEAVVAGTIQLPGNGLPIVLLGDCQTIGGYPKIAHVITVDLPKAAQLQPNDEVRFELVTLGRAQELLLGRERDIALFRAGIEARFG